jgi:hypothetical protein
MKDDPKAKQKTLGLIEWVIFVAILAGILTPVIGGLLETARQTVDNANARMLYIAAAIWFLDNSKADPDLDPVDLADYVDTDDFPAAKSRAFLGRFSISVSENGDILVKTTKPAVYTTNKGLLTQ